MALAVVLAGRNARLAQAIGVVVARRGIGNRTGVGQAAAVLVPGHSGRGIAMAVIVIAQAAVAVALVFAIAGGLAGVIGALAVAMTLAIVSAGMAATHATAEATTMAAAMATTVAATISSTVSAPVASGVGGINQGCTAGQDGTRRKDHRTGGCGQQGFLSDQFGASTGFIPRYAL